MEAERAKVLEMLKEGKISVEDAERLLDALTQRRQPATPPPPAHPDEESSGLVERITKTVLRTLQIPPVPPVPPVPGVPAVPGVPVVAYTYSTSSSGSRSPDPGVAAVLRLHEHGVDADYVEELAGTGANFTIEQIIRLHDEGVEADYASTLGGQFGVDDIIALHNAGVDADDVEEYVSALRSAGITSSAEVIVKLSDESVDPSEAASHVTA